MRPIHSYEIATQLSFSICMTYSESEQKMRSTSNVVNKSVSLWVCLQERDHEISSRDSRIRELEDELEQYECKMEYLEHTQVHLQRSLLGQLIPNRAIIFILWSPLFDVAYDSYPIINEAFLPCFSGSDIIFICYVRQ